MDKKHNGIEVSYFENFLYVKDALFPKIIECIKNGFWTKPVQLVQEAKARGSDEWESLKKQLPAFTASATFDKRRGAEYLSKYNQLVGIDIDKITDNAEDLKKVIQKANRDKHTYASFISPSGTGIKLFVRVNTAVEYHENAFIQVTHHFMTLLGIDYEKFDPKCKDITRLCYISDDPNAYLNEDSAIFRVNVDVRYVTEYHKPSHAAKQVSFTENSSQFQKCVELTMRGRSFEEGNRNDIVRLLAGNCNRWGIAKEEALEQIVNSDFNYNEKEVIPTIHSAYSKTHQFNTYPLRKSSSKKLARIIKSAAEENESLPVSDFATSYTESSPVISKYVYDNLPDLLKKGVAPFEGDRRRDIFLTGSLAVLSGCFPNFSGEYDQKAVWPNLYAFISAPAGSGKGILEFSKFYCTKFHDFIAETPVEPDKAKPLFLIPGNSSDAVVTGHLESTVGIGIFFETEANSMTNNFGKEWGDFSVLLRVAFHHETFQYSRKGNNNEYIVLKRPKVSVILSGTPGQIGSLTKSVEDGLFSRFFFYHFDADPKWRDPSPKKGDRKLDEYFNEISEEVYEIIKSFYDRKISFKFTENQWLHFNKVQQKELDEACKLYGKGIQGIINRNGLRWYRLAMVLTAISYKESLENTEEIKCNNMNFELAGTLAAVYLKHTLEIYESLPKPQPSQHEININNFFEALPNGEFKRDVAVEIGSRYQLNANVVSKTLAKFVQAGRLKDSPNYSFYIK